MVFNNQGLIDECPRCGEFSDCDARDYEAHRAHLVDCNDASKHKQYSLKNEKLKRKAEDRLHKRNVQDEISQKAVFDFLGAKKENLWMLTDEQLKKQCVQLKIDYNGKNHDEVIAALSTAKKSTENVGNRIMFDSNVKNRKLNNDSKLKLDVSSLPTNLNRCSVAQLKAVCASHGFVPVGKSKSEIIDEIESKMYDGNSESNSDSDVLLIE